MAIQFLFAFNRDFDLKHFLKIFTALLALTFFEQAGFAAEKNSSISAQYAALAPNAGGQTAYSLRYATSDWEAGGFSNQYLQSGNAPLTGLFIEKVFGLCKKDCFWNFNIQAGAGISNGGPFTQLTWSGVLPILPIWLPRQAPRFIPALRLDITTQMIYVPYRVITWSYPLWAGLSYPF